MRLVCAISGFNILTGLNMSNSALIFVGLDDWKKREAPELRAAAITRAWNQKFSGFPEARIFAFGPPALPGYGNVAGFTLQLQDRSGGSVDTPRGVGPAIYCRSVQTAGDRALNDDVPANYAAVEHNARSGKSAGRRREG